MPPPAAEHSHGPLRRANALPDQHDLPCPVAPGIVRHAARGRVHPVTGTGPVNGLPAAAAATAAAAAVPLGGRPSRFPPPHVADPVRGFRPRAAALHVALPCMQDAACPALCPPCHVMHHARHTARLATCASLASHACLSCRCGADRHVCMACMQALRCRSRLRCMSSVHACVHA